MKQSWQILSLDMTDRAYIVCFNMFQPVLTWAVHSSTVFCLNGEWIQHDTEKLGEQRTARQDGQSPLVGNRPLRGFVTELLQEDTVRSALKVGRTLWSYGMWIVLLMCYSWVNDHFMTFNDQLSFNLDKWQLDQGRQWHGGKRFREFCSGKSEAWFWWVHNEMFACLINFDQFWSCLHIWPGVAADVALQGINSKAHWHVRWSIFAQLKQHTAKCGSETYWAYIRKIEKNEQRRKETKKQSNEESPCLPVLYRIISQTGFLSSRFLFGI